MLRPSLARRFPYPRHAPPNMFPPLPAVPPGALPQVDAPTKLQKGIQLTGFVLATGLTFYSVLLYDFGERDHCFIPVRKYFDEASSGFFTLSNNDRQLLGGNSTSDAATILPSTKTPIAFFNPAADQPTSPKP